jgi:predicted Zn-dependent protease
MSTASIKPLIIMRQSGLENLEIKAVTDAIYDLLVIAKIQEKIQFSDIRSGIIDFRLNKILSTAGYKDIDWYLDRAIKVSKRENQLDADEILNQVAYRIMTGGQNHYLMMILNKDIYCEDTNFVIGVAKPMSCTIISTFRFRSLQAENRYECIKTETLHELGHVFCLPSKNRKTNVEESLGKHCTNICVMRQGLNVPEDWEKISKDRVNYGPFCETCTNDLIAFFKADSI